MRLQLERIHIDHDLAIPPAEGLRDGSAGHVGDLVAHIVLAQVAQGCFLESLALQGDQADGQAGRVELQHHGREGARRQAPQVGHRQVGNAGDGGIGVNAGLEIDFDNADAGERARLHVVNAGRQRKESLEAAGDVVFDLLRRHAGEKRGHHHHRDLDGGKEVHRQAHQAGHPHHANHEADHHDQERITDGKTRHGSLLTLASLPSRSRYDRAGCYSQIPGVLLPAAIDGVVRRRHNEDGQRD